MNKLKELIENSIEVSMAEIAPIITEVILEGIGDLSLDEFMGVVSGNGGTKAAAKSSSKKTSSGGKRIRRSAEALQEVAEQIASYVRKHKDGVSAEQIREELGIERKDIPLPIAEALGQRLITKRGQKRATMYFAGSKAGAGKKPAKKAAKKAAPKKASKKKKATKQSKSKSPANGVTAAAASAPSAE
jgi:hypothetical protein